MLIAESLRLRIGDIPKETRFSKHSRPVYFWQIGLCWKECRAPAMSDTRTTHRNNAWISNGLLCRSRIRHVCCRPINVLKQELCNSRARWAWFRKWARKCVIVDVMMWRFFVCNTRRYSRLCGIVRIRK